MNYQALCEKIINANSLITDSKERVLTIFREKNLFGEYYFAFFGKYNSIPNIEPDFSSYRGYINNTITINDDQNQEVIKIKKNSNKPIYSVFNADRFFCSVYLINFKKVQPRKTFIILPNKKNQEIPHWNEKFVEAQIQYLIKNKNYPSMHILENETPIYEQKIGYSLKFNQSDGILSSKNCKIICNNELVFELLRRKNNFGVIFKEPFSPAIAFACFIIQCWHID